MNWGREDQKCQRLMTPRTRIQNVYIIMYIYECIWKISFAFDLGSNFDSISLKLGRTAFSMENWSCLVFWINSAQWGRTWGLPNFENFWKIMFFWTQLRDFVAYTIVQLPLLVEVIFFVPRCLFYLDSLMGATNCRELASVELALLSMFLLRFTILMKSRFIQYSISSSIHKI